jgi:methyl-accepting chemotaxis protein WspA
MTMRAAVQGWTIRRRIIASFGVVLGLMIAMSMVAFRDLATIDRHAGTASATSVPGLYASTDIQT